MRSTSTECYIILALTIILLLLHVFGQKQNKNANEPYCAADSECPPNHKCVFPGGAAGGDGNCIPA